MKKLFALLLSLLFLCGIVTPAFAAEDVPDGYTPIRTAEDLNNIRNDLSGKYILMNDIDLSAFGEWTPIGIRFSPFEGVLNGNGHTIRGLQSFEALFLFIQNAKICNLCLLDCVISGKDGFFGKTASIAVEAKDSSFEKCLISGEISAYCGRSMIWSPVIAFSGALVGLANQCSFVNCGAQTNVTMYYEKNGDRDDERAVGGFVGKSTNSSFENCYSVGTVEAVLVQYSEENEEEIVYEPADPEDRIFVGGFVGVTDRASVFKTCYCEDQAATAFGKGIPENAMVELHTNEALKQATTYQGFDFESVWTIDEGRDYPKPIAGTIPESRIEQINIFLRYKEKKQVLQGKATDYRSEDETIAVAEQDGSITATGVGKTTVYFVADEIKYEIFVSVTYTWWQQLIRIFLLGFLWY